MATLEEQLKEIFTAKNLTLATAESCTGGLLSARITDVSGSSAYFLGGVVSYANSAKEALLGVEHELLMTHGAVSAAVARQMAHGARERLGADVGISVTGIAGPTGGTPEKPVGLVWIGLSDAEGEQAARFQWAYDRAGNREHSVEAALRMLIEWGKVATPR
ncbi:MAG TPA: CinA family protein [Chloroflexi bacterium]|nr:CinA family protein [Chloroflexota bacterium]